jgi:hypothetical protein
MTFFIIEKGSLFISGRVVDVSEGKLGPLSNRKIMSEVFSLTRHKMEMNRNLVAPTLYKTKMPEVFVKLLHVKVVVGMTFHKASWIPHDFQTLLDL